MPRRVFYSFHYDADSWRASQVRNMGKFDGQVILASNKWEEVKRGGDQAIERWISSQMEGKSCLVLLIGSATAGRRWINHEIVTAWTGGRALVGVHVHGLKDRNGYQSQKGRNPFSDFNIDGQNLSTIVPTFDTPFSSSSLIYGHIADNLTEWVEEAIEVRSKWS